MLFRSEKIIKELESKHIDKKKAINEINQIEEKYQEDCKKWATLNGDMITSDIKLLNSPIELNANDYEKLEKKYQNNYSMLKAIKDHARKNDIHYKKSNSIDEAEKGKALEGVLTAGRNIIDTISHDGAKSNYLSSLWEHEDKFEVLYSDTSKMIQLD